MKNNIGFRIFTNFERPSEDLVQMFKDLPSSNVGDTANRLFCMRHEIKPFNNKPLLGVALTVRVAAGDNLMLHKAMDIAKPGDIIVVDGEGCSDRALMGEMMVVFAQAKGIGGFVLDGAIRDVDALSQAGIPVYAKAVTPQGPYKNGPGEINVPIACGGQVVFPGDIILGDADGIVVIRPEYAKEIAEIAIKKHKKEVERAKQMLEGDPNMENEHASKYDKFLSVTDVQHCD